MVSDVLTAWRLSMNTITPFSNALHIANHRRSIGRQLRTNRSDNSKQRISVQLQRISDEYGTDNLVMGLTKSLSDHAYDNLNHQLGNTTLPPFLKDELHNSLQDLRTASDNSRITQCRVECRKVYEEFLPLDSEQLAADTPVISDETPEKETPSPELSKAFTEKPEWSWRNTLSYIYKKTIFQNTKSSLVQNGNDTDLNWLTALAGDIAALQVRFIQAAMENIRTMAENSELPQQSQESLEALQEEDRQLYFSLRKSKRERFLTAQSQYKLNLHLFNLVSGLLMSIFNLFSHPCRYDTT
jgi:hypothetical protein